MSFSGALCFFISVKIVRVWLEYFASLIIIIRHCSSDYYPFRSLQNFLDGIRFASSEDVQNHFEHFFAEKTQECFTKGIVKLRERRQKRLSSKMAHILLIKIVFSENKMYFNFV